jgi:SMC interacting uncharacterized protein involved in chromosome segregation
MNTVRAHSTYGADTAPSENEKSHADLNRTRAETRKMDAEIRKLNLDASRYALEVLKTHAETHKAEADAKKLAMDTMKAQLEIRWYTYIVSGSIALAWFSAGAAFVTGLMKLVSLWDK